MNQLMVMNNEVTMSSREISSLVEARHNDVISTIDRLFDKGLLRSSRKTRREETGGRPIEVYDLIERDTHLVVAGYSDEHRARVIDRWQELEAARKPAIPQTYAAALLEAGRLAMELEHAEARLAIAAPKAEFVDRYVDATGTYGFRQVAKMLSVKENWFSEFLIEKDIMYRLSGKLTAHRDHIDAGRFVARAGVAKNDHAFTECRFTAKGVEWVAGEIAKHKAVAAIAKK